MKIGAKVVCVTTKWYLFRRILGIQFKIRLFFGNPKKDKVYIVANTAFNTTYNVDVIQIEGFGDEWFMAICFQPVDESFAEGVLENILEQIKEEIIHQ